jgi:hypothetical protein
MGRNLDRLMQSYGVYTPTVSAYSGVATPDALKAGATAGERGTYQGALADYAAQQDAFKGYETDYKNRIANTNLYTSPGPASTFLSTPNYSDITGMRANLSDTTSADATDYTNPDFSSMINDAYRSLGRVGIGTDTGNIDQPGYNYWMGQLQAGANGGIAPRDFKNQFKIATNDYIKQKPDDDYTKYIQGYLGILPPKAMTLVDEPTGNTPDEYEPGNGGNGGGGEGGGGWSGMEPAGAAGDTMAQISALGDFLSGLGGQQPTADYMADVNYGGYGEDDGGNTGGSAPASGPGTGIDNAYASGGRVRSPTSMEEAIFRDRSRHKFPEPGFEELYGKYFYDRGGSVADPTLYPRPPGLPGFFPQLPGYTFRNNPGNLPDLDDNPEQKILPPNIISLEDELGGVLGGRSRAAATAPATVPATVPATAPAAGPAATTATATNTTSRMPPGASYAPSSFSPETLIAAQNASEAQAAFMKNLTSQLDQKNEDAPSQAEKYFRLAAAFGAPTKTGKGGFMESVSLAAGALADFEKSTTDSKKAARAQKLQTMLKSNEITWQVAKEELRILQARDREEARERRANQLAAIASNKPSDRQKKIAEIAQSQNISLEQAADLVNGVLVLRPHPVTGMPTIYSALTGVAVDRGAPAPDAPPPAGAATPDASTPAGAYPQEATAWELASTPRTTGVGPAVAQVLQKTLGQIGLNPVTPEFTERRQKLLNMQNEVIRGIINNPRFPVSEQDRIRNEINIYPSISTDPQTLLANIRALDSTLRTILAKREREGADINLPATGRQEAILAANEVRNLLKILGVPKKDNSGAQPGQNNIPPAPRVGDKQTDANGKMRVFIGGDPASESSWPLVAEGGGQ